MPNSAITAPTTPRAGQPKTRRQYLEDYNNGFDGWAVYPHIHAPSLTASGASNGAPRAFNDKHPQLRMSIYPTRENLEKAREVAAKVLIGSRETSVGHIPFKLIVLNNQAGNANLLSGRHGHWDGAKIDYRHGIPPATDERGSELRIDLGIINEQHPLDVVPLNHLMCTLWAEMLKAGVKVGYVTAGTGFYPITCAPGLSSPFSYKLADAYKASEALNEAHVIAAENKEFALQPAESALNNPFAQVTITSENLLAYDIDWQSIEQLQAQRSHYLKQHCNNSEKDIINQLQNIFAKIKEAGLNKESYILRAFNNLENNNDVAYLRHWQTLEAESPQEIKNRLKRLLQRVHFLFPINTLYRKSKIPELDDLITTLEMLINHDAADAQQLTQEFPALVTKITAFITQHKSKVYDTVSLAVGERSITLRNRFQAEVIIKWFLNNGFVDNNKLLYTNLINECIDYFPTAMEEVYLKLRFHLAEQQRENEHLVNIRNMHAKAQRSFAFSTRHAAELAAAMSVALLLGSGLSAVSSLVMTHAITITASIAGLSALTLSPFGVAIGATLLLVAAAFMIYFVYRLAKREYIMTINPDYEHSSELGHATQESAELNHSYQEIKSLIEVREPSDPNVSVDLPPYSPNEVERSRQIFRGFMNDRVGAPNEAQMAPVLESIISQVLATESPAQLPLPSQHQFPNVQTARQ